MWGLYWREYLRDLTERVLGSADSSVPSSSNVANGSMTGKLIIGKVAAHMHDTLLELARIYAIRLICSKSEAQLTDLMPFLFHSSASPLQTYHNLKSSFEDQYTISETNY